MKLTKTTIPGCYILEQEVHADARGAFVKVFRKSFFREHGLECDFSEQYYSESKKDVIRGMHFQTPPSDHAKLVTIIEGIVIDVILDIRKRSPAYGKFEAFELSRENGKSIYIPRGCAHGFCTMSEQAIAFYMVSSEYDPKCDKGIAYNSFGYNWPPRAPIISPRDATFDEFHTFATPFVNDLQSGFQL